MYKFLKKKKKKNIYIYILRRNKHRVKLLLSPIAWDRENFFK